MSGHLCECGHAIEWHHDERGCQYLGNNPEQRCPCLLDSDAVAAHIIAARESAAVEAFRAKAVAAIQSAHPLANEARIVRDLPT